VRQEPPLPISVEAAPGSAAEQGRLPERIRRRLREKFLVTADITLVAEGSLPRSEWKSELVEKV